MGSESSEAKSPCTISKGWIDAGYGANCSQLVYDDDNFLVFIDDCLDVDWTTEPNDTMNKIISTTEFNAIRHKMSYLEAIPCHHDDDIKITFKRLLGESLVSALLEDYKTAQDGLAKAQEFIDNRNSEVSRKWILEEALQYALIALIGILGLLLLHPLIVVSSYEKYFWLALALPFGMIGAFLSIRLRIGATITDCSSGKNLHQIETRARLLAGGVCAVIAALAIYADILTPKAIPAESTHYFVMLISCAAGFSERWAPAILKNLTKTPESSSQPSQKKSSASHSDSQ